MVMPFHRLTLWKKAVHVGVTVFKVCQFFPQDRESDLVVAMKQHAVDIARCLERGYTEPSMHEFIGWYRKSFISASDVYDELRIARNLGFIGDNTYRAIDDEVQELLYLIAKQIRVLEHMNGSLHSQMAYSHSLLKW